MGRLGAGGQDLLRRRALVGRYRLMPEGAGVRSRRRRIIAQPTRSPGSTRVCPMHEVSFSTGIGLTGAGRSPRRRSSPATCCSRALGEPGRTSQPRLTAGSVEVCSPGPGTRGTCHREAPAHLLLTTSRAATHDPFQVETPPLRTATDTTPARSPGDGVIDSSPTTSPHAGGDKSASGVRPDGMRRLEDALSPDRARRARNQRTDRQADVRTPGPESQAGPGTGVERRPAVTGECDNGGTRTPVGDRTHGVARLSRNTVSRMGPCQGRIVANFRRGERVRDERHLNKVSAPGRRSGPAKMRRSTARRTEASGEGDLRAKRFNNGHGRTLGDLTDKYEH